MDLKRIGMLVVLGSLLVTVAASGSVVAETVADDTAEDICYIWIDGKTYCCEQTSSGDIRCEVPPRPWFV